MTAILPSVVGEGRRLAALAKGAGTALPLLGGVAVRVRAQDVPAVLDRDYKDLDFAVPKGGNKAATELLTAAGYEPDVQFNALNGAARLMFHDLEHGRQVDVFVGSFRMCHEVPLADRVVAGEVTIPLAELLLTKLQIVELNEKDVRDTVLLLHGHEVADLDGEAVNGERVAELCAADWGLWRTITANLRRVGELVDDYSLGDEGQRIASRIEELLARIEQVPKSRGWKLRARIGDRKRWYELPEEVDG